MKVIAAIWMMGATLVVAAPADAPDALPMFHDPELQSPQQKYEIDPAAISLLQKAMARPEVDVRISAIDALIDVHRKQAAKLNIAAMTPMLTALLEHEQNVYVRDAAARALAALDAKDAAPLLVKAMVDRRISESTITEHVCDALTRWNDEQAMKAWMQWLSQPVDSPMLMTAAISGLQSVHATEAAPLMLKYSADEQLEFGVRLAAARAAATLDAQSIEPIAQRLMSSDVPASRLIGLSLLGSKTTAESAQWIREQMAFADGRVRATAMRRLVQIDAGDFAARYKGFATDADASVRLLVINGLCAYAPGESTDVLAGAMSDTNQGVRDAAAEALVKAGALPASKDAVAVIVREKLLADDWRALYEAASVAGKLRLTAMSDELVRLLSHDRHEVRLASATALRLLALPQTAPAVLRRCHELTAQAPQALGDAVRYAQVGDETTQLFMLLGRLGEQSAKPLLVRYIPKRSGYAPMARAAAIYALGLMLEGRVDKDLADQLEARAVDNNPLDPEAPEVRRFSAIALGRMGSEASLEALQSCYEAENSTVSSGGACRWAIQRIKHIELPQLRPITLHPGPYFLEPIQNQR